VFSSDNRATNYLSGQVDTSLFASTGFRWDFLLYSAVPVFTGWYYIYKKKYYDRHYNLLYATYLIANSFWILVIKANYSNRFAYLSWFMMGLVIVYPLLKKYIVSKQQDLIIYVCLTYF